MMILFDIFNVKITIITIIKVNSKPAVLSPFITLSLVAIFTAEARLN